MDKTFLSVVIPAYNEAKNVAAGSLDKVNDYLKKQEYSYEVIIVDDGSTDQTVKLVEKEIKNKKNFRLIKNEHGGKAITVMTGMLEAKGEIAVFTDMDQATPIESIERLLPKFDQGYDIVIGSRGERKGAPLVRKLLAYGFIAARTIIVNVPYKDTQCGFKAFNKRAREEVFKPLLEKWQKMRSHGSAVNAGFDTETLFLASKKGFKIVPVEVEWRHVQSERVQAITDSIDAIKDLLRIRINDLLGRYN